jgi:hypothetical protein
MQTTPAEDKATVQGAIAYFGTYTVNEADRSYTNHVDGSSYPNWNGTDLKQVVESITADELKIRNPAPSYGVVRFAPVDPPPSAHMAVSTSHGTTGTIEAPAAARTGSLLPDRQDQPILTPSF